MIWDKASEQPAVVRVLKRHLETGRLASTYLFTGARYAGCFEASLAFAAAANCEKGKIFESCDCSVCRRIVSGQYPDTKILGQHENRSIKIEEVRNLLGWASLKPYEGKKKVFVVDGAERLTLEAQNALLKTLEEPPETAIICLITESRSNLLETIQSRCFELRFRASSMLDEPDPSVLAHEFSSAENGVWEDFLTARQNLKREELSKFFLSLIYYFRNCMNGTISLPQPAPHAAYVEAIETVCDTKEAVEANVNIKLALSRLAMKLKRILP